MKEFTLQTHVYFGSNSLSRLDEVRGRVMIVCDKFIVQSGIVDTVKSHLKSCDVYVFDEVVPDPPIDVIARGIYQLEQFQANAIIAVGGGSSIDSAKAMRQLANKKGNMQIKECYAIPTTSGTGSEVTQYSVITDPKAGVKYPLVDKDLQPMVAILDPDLVASVPPAITADTGIDALAHAMESYVSADANDFTDSLAEKSITLLAKFLPMAYKDGSDMLAREKVHNAASLAGMAFNITGVGLSHGLAHAIGAKFHISHGRAIGLTLPSVILFNAGFDINRVTVDGNGHFVSNWQGNIAGLGDYPERVSSNWHGNMPELVSGSYSNWQGNIPGLGDYPERVTSNWHGNMPELVSGGYSNWQGNIPGLGDSPERVSSNWQGNVVNDSVNTAVSNWPGNPSGIVKAALDENGQLPLAARKYQRLARIVGLPHSSPENGVANLVRSLEQMKHSFGMPATLQEAGIDPQEVRLHKKELIDAALNDRCTGTNPRKPDADDIEAILEKITPL